MLNRAFECLSKAGLKIKLSKCPFFREQIHYLGHLVSGTSILPCTDKIETLMKLKAPTSTGEVGHLLVLTDYYRKFIYNYSDIACPLGCLACRSQPFICTLGCQSGFYMLHSRLANTPIVQLPDPNGPCLLYMDASKFCCLGMLAQASTDGLSKAHMELFTNKDPNMGPSPQN